MHAKPSLPLKFDNPHVDEGMMSAQLKPRCVAGVDTSSFKFHMYCNNGRRAHMTIPDRPVVSPDDRRHRLYDYARVAFSRLPNGTVLIVEEPLALKNGKTTRLLGLAAGAIWAAHLDYPLLWAWADVAAWKRVVIGNGNANKEQIKTWVTGYMPLNFPEEEPDYYDAAALCRYGEICLGLVEATSET